MIELNEIQKYQLDFCLRYQSYGEIGPFQDLDALDRYAQKHDKFVCIHLTEVYHQKDQLEQLQRRVEQYRNQGKEVYIAQATSSKIKYGLDPLINLIFWRAFKSRQTISCDWDNDLMFDENKYNDINKIHKGILSVRKRTPKRNYLFSKIKNFDGLLRYSEWPQDDGVEKEEDWLNKVDLKNYPTWYELIDEYKSSYCSFVIESECGFLLNQLSEKTIIAFLTKTLPIVLGGRGYVKELEDMGFWVANKELGFDIDNLPTESYIRYDTFSDAIKKYNEFSIDEIKELYIKNKEKIQNNFNIMSYFVFGKRMIA